MPYFMYSEECPDSNFETGGWTHKECKDSLTYANFTGQSLAKCFCYLGNEEVPDMVLDWPMAHGWHIDKDFYQELVDNQIITHYNNKEEYDSIHLQQGNRTE